MATNRGHASYLGTWIFSISAEVLWDVIINDIPKLTPNLRILIEEFKSDDITL